MNRPLACEDGHLTTTVRKAAGRRRRARFKAVRATILFLVCTWLQPVSTIGRAQTQATEPQPATRAAPTDMLTLPVAVDIALRTNPLIRATTSGQELARAQIGEARAGRYPIVQFGETFARSNNPVFVFGSLLEQGRFGPQNFECEFVQQPRLAKQLSHVDAVSPSHLRSASDRHSNQSG